MPTATQIYPVIADFKSRSSDTLFVNDCITSGLHKLHLSLMDTDNPTPLAPPWTEESEKGKYPHHASPYTLATLKKALNGDDTLPDEARSAPLWDCTVQAMSELTDTDFPGARWITPRLIQKSMGSPTAAMADIINLVTAPYPEITCRKETDSTLSKSLALMTYGSSPDLMKKMSRDNAVRDERVPSAWRPYWNGLKPTKTDGASLYALAYHNPDTRPVIASHLAPHAWLLQKCHNLVDNTWAKAQTHTQFDDGIKAGITLYLSHLKQRISHYCLPENQVHLIFALDFQAIDLTDLGVITDILESGAENRFEYSLTWHEQVSNDARHIVFMYMLQHLKPSASQRPTARTLIGTSLLSGLPLELFLPWFAVEIKRRATALLGLEETRIMREWVTRRLEDHPDRVRKLLHFLEQVEKSIAVASGETEAEGFEDVRLSQKFPVSRITDLGINSVDRHVPKLDRLHAQSLFLHVASQAPGYEVFNQ